MNHPWELVDHKQNFSPKNAKLTEMYVSPQTDSKTLTIYVI